MHRWLQQCLGSLQNDVVGSLHARRVYVYIGVIGFKFRVYSLFDQASQPMVSNGWQKLGKKAGQKRRS